MRCSINLFTIKSNPVIETQLHETVTRALAKESYDPNELENALSSKRSKLSLVNSLLFQGLEKEFGKGKLLGLNFTVHTARTLVTFVKKMRGNA